jgi:hypothetical protein
MHGQTLIKIGHLCLGEEERVRVFEDRVPREIFGPKRNEVTGMWRKLHNEEHHDLQSLPNIHRVSKLWRMQWVGHVGRMDKNTNVYRILMGKSEEND